MKEITLTLTLDEVNLLLTSMAEMPFRISNGLIGKVQHQANEQLALKEGGK